MRRKQGIRGSSVQTEDGCCRSVPEWQEGGGLLQLRALKLTLEKGREEKRLESLLQQEVRNGSGMCIR